MRRDEQRLTDILEALETASRFVCPKSEAEFLEDELLRSAVAQQLTVVGEAAARNQHRTPAAVRLRALGGHHRFSQHYRPRILWNPLADGVAH
jgi:hypothetical protein